MSSAKFDLEKFNGKIDFRLWRVKMRALLVHQGLVGALTDEGSLTTTLTDIQKSDIMEKAHSAIILILGDRVLREVSKETTAAGMWSKMEGLYMTKSLANMLYLKKRLYTFRWHQWHEPREESGEGLSVRGRTEFRDQKHKQPARSKETHGSDTFSDGYESAELLVVSQSGSREEWILDSGCSYHVTPNREYFSKYKEYNLGSMMLGDDRECEIKGIGTIVLKLSDGTDCELQDVRHIPKLRRNLISLGLYEKNGHMVKLEGGKLKVIKGSLVVFQGNRRSNNIYFLEGKVQGREVVNVAYKQMTNTMLWHKRLGHISNQGLVELNKNCVFGKLKIGDAEYIMLSSNLN